MRPHTLWHALLGPATRWMDWLAFPYKFAFIALLAVGAMLYQFALVAGNVAEDLATTNLELAGLAVDRPLISLLRVVQQHRGLATAVATGLQQMENARRAKQAEVETALLAADQQLAEHADNLRLTAQWAQAKEQWALLRRGAGQLRATESRDAHDTLVRQLLTLMATVNDTSRLILDPQAASYNLMDAITLKLPAALEAMGQLRLLGLRVLAQKHLAPAEHDLLAANTTLMQLRGDELEAVLLKLYPGQPQQSALVAGFARQFRLAREQLVQTIKGDLLSGHYSLPPQDYYGHVTTAMDAAYDQAQQLLIPSLQDLLQARSAQWRRQLVLMASLALVFLLVFLYFGLGAYASMMASITALRAGADRLAAGDLSTRIVLTSQDELRSAADSLNHLAEQLAQGTARVEQAGAPPQHKTD